MKESKALMGLEDDGKLILMMRKNQSIREERIRYEEFDLVSCCCCCCVV